MKNLNILRKKYNFLFKVKFYPLDIKDYIMAKKNLLVEVTFRQGVKKRIEIFDEHTFSTFIIHFIKSSPNKS